MNLGYTQSQGNVINAYSGTQGTSTLASRPAGFDAAMSFNQTMQNQQQSSVEGTGGQMPSIGQIMGQRTNGTMGAFSGAYTNEGLIGQQLPMREEQPYQGERPDMDSDDADEQRDGELHGGQQERADDPGEEFNARE